MDTSMQVSAAEAAGFKPPEAQTALAHRAASEVAARERSQLEAAVAMARMNPRDEFAAVTRILEACKRPAFAEGATYEFPRGGQNVSGASVSLARPLAAMWGHVRYGQEIVDETDESVHVRCYAYDVQTGAYVSREGRIKKLIQRRNKSTGVTEWTKPDERDLRELIGRHAAIHERNAILAILPPDIVDRALQTCAKTLKDEEGGKLEKNRSDTILNITIAFSDFGVDTPMLEKYLGHELKTITTDELVRLRGIYNSIKDKNSRVEEHFERPQAKQPTPSASIDLSQAKPGVAVDPAGGSTLGTKAETTKAVAGELPLGDEKR